VHPFDDPDVIAGQGTVGMEILRQTDRPIHAVFVAVGGGGLIGGIAACYAGDVRVVGVEPHTAPTLSRALEAGRPVDAEAGGIAADSLAPRRVGELTFQLAQRHVARVVLVSDDAIRRAQHALWDGVRVVAEPGAAAGFAALLDGAYAPAAGERVGVLISGANTTAVDFH
jgi:threonine dehydratase